MNAAPEVIKTSVMKDSATKTVESISKRTSIEYTDLTVIVGSNDKDGNRQEQVHVIDGEVVNIAKVLLLNEEKQRACKNDEGNIVGYEPSGEVNLKLEVKYFVP